MKSITIGLLGACLMSSAAFAAPVKLSDDTLGMVTAGSRFEHHHGNFFGAIQTNVNNTRQIAISTAITVVTCIACSNVTINATSLASSVNFNQTAQSNRH
jgi:ribosomal protein S27E